MSIPGVIIPGLERIEGLLEVMGHPEGGLKYVHIAGTNGKGSTGLIIASILQESGYKVGIYSSPHLHSYTERFRINGEPIPQDRLEVYVERMKQYVDAMVKRGYDAPSEFEILTALAFQYFYDEQPDFVILETGMGGIYDTTNVVVPVVSVITGIDFDHTAYLGETLQEIAFNKAGIIKPGRPVVVGPMPEEALNVIRNKAENEQALLYSSDLFRVASLADPGLSGQRVNIAYGGEEIRDVQFSLAGLHQQTNLVVALTALLVMAENMGYPASFSAGGALCSEPVIRRALAALKHPGRLEVMSEHPLVIVDAAHNPQGTRALTESLAAILPGRDRILVCGWLNDKDVINSLQPFGRETRLCIVTRPAGARGTEWQRVAGIWQELNPHKSWVMEESIIKAVDRGLELLQGDEYLLITGSFYVLDEARSHLLAKNDKLSIC